MAGLRGVYSIFPSSDPPKPLGPHTDRIAQQLNCATYLMDVPPGGAPFTVWPGVITTALVLTMLLSLGCVFTRVPLCLQSHLVISRGGHRGQANWYPTEQFRPLLEEVRRTIEPVELVRPVDASIERSRFEALKP